MINSLHPSGITALVMAGELGKAMFGEEVWQNYFQ